MNWEHVVAVLRSISSRGIGARPCDEYLHQSIAERGIAALGGIGPLGTVLLVLTYLLRFQAGACVRCTDVSIGFVNLFIWVALYANAVLTLTLAAQQKQRLFEFLEPEDLLSSAGTA